MFKLVHINILSPTSVHTLCPLQHGPQAVATQTEEWHVKERETMLKIILANILTTFDLNWTTKAECSRIVIRKGAKKMLVVQLNKIYNLKLVYLKNNPPGEIGQYTCSDAWFIDVSIIPYLYL